LDRHSEFETQSQLQDLLRTAQFGPLLEREDGEASNGAESALQHQGDLSLVQTWLVTTLQSSVEQLRLRLGGGHRKDEDRKEGACRLYLHYLHVAAKLITALQPPPPTAAASMEPNLALRDTTVNLLFDVVGTCLVEGNNPNNPLG
jgi:hypothetical protein